MNRFDPLPLLASFLAGAIIPIPGYLLVLAGWVPALRASLLLSSLVCIVAASAPWWTDAIETRRNLRILRDRGITLKD
jgi:hypothetical protein